jgi:hypothetical protein
MVTMQQPQRQDSLDAQLRDVIALANRAGCYDAADLISRQFFPENHALPTSKP